MIAECVSLRGMWKGPALVLGLSAALGGFGCNKSQDEGAKPSGVPPLPAAAQPPAPTAPAPAPTAPAPTAPAAADPAATITGAIVIPAAMAKLKPNGTLYLVARRPSDNPSARGTMIAVKKMPATKFPLEFTLSAADMPFQNGPFDGDLVLTARIDQDGDPMSHQKGDMLGTLNVHVGAHGVTLPLDQVQKESESLAGPPPGHP
jgi:hypothetical protein